MKSREELLRDYERSIFALMMDELGQEEGEEALREWEKLERGEGFQASEESMTRCWQAAEGVYRRERLRHTGRRCVWVLRKAALTAAVCVLCLATALAVSAEFRRDTLGVLLRTFALHEEKELSLTVGWVPERSTLIEEGGDDQSQWKSYNILEIEVTRSQETGYRIDPKNYMEVEDISINGRQGQLLHRPSSAFRGDRYGVLLYDTDRGITTIVITYGMSREEVLKVVGSIQY